PAPAGRARKDRRDLLSFPRPGRGRGKGARERRRQARSASGAGSRLLDVAGAHVRGARGARGEILGHGPARVREGLADRRHVGPEDALALGAAPQVGAGDGVERALEARHHVARAELVALEGVLAVRPLVGTEEDSPEAALRELDETLDALDHGVGRAHQGRAGLDTIPDGIVRAAGRPAQCLLEVRHGLVALPRVYLTQGELVVI